MTPRRRTTIRLRITAGVLGLVCLGHAALQGVGAAMFWRECFALGATSAACSFAQYEAPSPWWLVLQYAGWPVETALALVMAALAFALAQRRRTALASLIFVVSSNFLADYVLTPLFNGGYDSADNPPGYGLYGAVLLAVAGVLAIVVAVSVRVGESGSAPSPSRDRRPHLAG